MIGQTQNPSGAGAHTPVMLDEVVHALAPHRSGVIVDATFGGGGYARAILGAADCTVYGLDRDPEAIRSGLGWARAYGGRLRLIRTAFADMEQALASVGVDALDGAVFDLGVSSMQIDEADRGFSFVHDGPLDMRMAQEGPSAADVVEAATAEDLQEIFSAYGEERRARTIAAAVVAARDEAPIRRTAALAAVIEAAAGGRRGAAIHPATRCFQALRIFVNDELGQILKGLAAAEALLRPSGRLAVVTFHSLEDRLVKRFLAARSGRTPQASRHAPAAPAAAAPTFRLMQSKPLTPSDEEIRVNPRARSAKLRAAIRTEAPSSPLDAEAAAVRRPRISQALERRMSPS